MQAQHEQKPTEPLSALSAATTASAPNSSTLMPVQHLTMGLGKANVGGVETQRLHRRLEMFYKRVKPEHLGQVPAIVKIFERKFAITHPLLSHSRVHRVMQRERERERERENIVSKSRASLLTAQAGKIGLAHRAHGRILENSHVGKFSPTSCSFGKNLCVL
jgi:hypothetical protein